MSDLKIMSDLDISWQYVLLRHIYMKALLMAEL